MWLSEYKLGRLPIYTYTCAGVMETATYPVNLQALERSLQVNLNSELSLLVPIQVRCLLREASMIVLLQHPQPKFPRAKRAFAIMERTLEEERIMQKYGVLIYLRISGQKQPYAFHKIPLNSPQEKVAAQEESPDLIPSDWEEESLALTLDEEEQKEPQEPEESLALTLDEEEPKEQEEEEVTTPPAAPKKSWLPVAIAGTAISLFCFLGALYIFTRPCAVGKCEELPQAEKLAEESLDTIKSPQSGQEILQAQKQLQQSIAFFVSIPPWSSHYDRAQELLSAYHADAVKLEELVLALKTAARAGNMSQKLPLAEGKWLEIKELWREAITRLQKQTAESEFYEFAQGKIEEYELNLKIINQRLNQELQAKKYFEAAQETAQIAKVRQGVAQSAQHWQRVEATWEVAVEELKRISTETYTYAEAQKLAEEYSTQLAAAKKRQTQEKISSNAYNQALSLAHSAKEAEISAQWSDAVVNWRKALNSLKQVPENTFYSTPAQTLQSGYQQAFNRSQSQLQLALRAERVRGDLERTCSAQVKICYYTISNQIITVRLTPIYMQEVRLASLNAQARGDRQTQVALENHVFSLQRAFEAISNKAGITLAIYTPDGALVESHSPQ